jgi:anaerobic magnesium-protoporphyrin IX monomethyl ester cyclase
MGGPHLTIMPLESLQPPHDAYVDYVFKGEAEYSFLELVNTLEAGREPGVIPGIHFIRNGEIIASPESPMIPDLDALPFPAHDLFKIDRYTNLQPLTDGLDPHARSFTILTSRGCPYKCTFCSKPVTGDTWRRARWRAWCRSGSGWSTGWAPPRSASPTTSGTSSCRAPRNSAAG